MAGEGGLGLGKCCWLPGGQIFLNKALICNATNFACFMFIFMFYALLFLIVFYYYSYLCILYIIYFSLLMIIYIYRIYMSNTHPCMYKRKFSTLLEQKRTSLMKATTEVPKSILSEVVQGA